MRTLKTAHDDSLEGRIKRLNRHQKKVRMRDEQDLFDGRIRIYRTTHSGDVWQFQMWIGEEKKYIRKSLRTRDKEIAINLAEDLFIEARTKQRSGEKLFSMTAKELRSKYLEYIKERVEGGQLSEGRFTNIKTFTKHYSRFVGENSKIQNISEDFFEGYRAFRQSELATITMTVVQNESITVKQMYKWAVKKKFISANYVPDYGEIRVKKNEVKRKGYSVSNYDKLIKYGKLWWKKVPRNAKDRDEQVYYRRSIRDFILLMANFGFRTGELLQLRYKNVKVNDDATAKSAETATVKVLAETSKVRKERTIQSRRGDIFSRRKTYSKFCSEDSFVFSKFDKDEMMTTTSLYDYYKELKTYVKSKESNYDDSLDLYSLRHFWITLQLIHGKVDIHRIARFAGTSYTQIVNHYDNMKDSEVSKELLSVNLQFDVANDGIIVLKDNGAGEENGVENEQKKEKT